MIEIYFWKIAKWLIRRGYGADCPTTDLEDFGAKTANDVFHPGRCASCRAREIIHWIDGHVDLIQS